MTIQLLALILFSVVMSSIAQVVLKKGMSGATLLESIDKGSLVEVAWQLVTNVMVAAGLGLYLLGAAAWLFVLARAEVSYAYPFVGLGFILTMAMGNLILGEALSASRVLGTIFVFIGVFLVART